LTGTVDGYVYKILRPQEWLRLQHDGELSGSPDDLRDGFIHLSTRAQLQGTLDKYFASERDLVILRARADTLGEALRWEPSRGGALFPHLYRPLRLVEVEVCSAF
jgi:uncharacterized protein (DUF952 family)